MTESFYEGGMFWAITINLSLLLLVKALCQPREVYFINVSAYTVMGVEELGFLKRNDRLNSHP